MQQEAEGPAPFAFLGQNIGDILIRLAGMDGEWQASDLRRADMVAEILGLSLARGLVIEVIQAAFAKPDDARMVGQCGERLRPRQFPLPGIMRVDANGAEHAIKTLRQRLHLLGLGEARADGDHAANAGFLGAGNDIGDFRLDVIIEVAMAIHQHQAASISILRNSGLGGGSAVPPGSGVASAAKSRESSGTAS